MGVNPTFTEKFFFNNFGYDFVSRIFYKGLIFNKGHKSAYIKNHFVWIVVHRALENYS